MAAAVFFQQLHASGQPGGVAPLPHLQPLLQHVRRKHALAQRLRQLGGRGDHQLPRGGTGRAQRRVARDRGGRQVGAAQARHAGSLLPDLRRVGCEARCSGMDGVAGATPSGPGRCCVCHAAVARGPSAPPATATVCGNHPTPTPIPPAHLLAQLPSGNQHQRLPPRLALAAGQHAV